MDKSINEHRVEKMRACVTKAAINETLSNEAALRNFDQATNLTTVNEVFRVFVLPKLNRNGHRLQSFIEIDMVAFLERIDTAIPLLQSTPLRALK